MNSLTVAFITSRKEPKFDWFVSSLRKQPNGNSVNIIVVDGQVRGLPTECIGDFVYTAPKPTIWQGEHRITKEDWWAKSNALNTAICLCKTEWIAFVDDRSVLMPGWLDCIYDAMKSEYAVCGNYEKRANLKVVDGVISDPGITLGTDTRTQHDRPYRVKDLYGGHCALPLEWCLQVNGWSEELCDSLGSEDSCFGMTLHNSGLHLCYDPRMKIIEDRTPGQIDGALKRADKGLAGTNQDKSHRIVSIMRDKTTSQNSYDIRNLRDRVLAGESLQSIMPSASHFDWFDGQPISEMT